MKNSICIRMFLAFYSACLTWFDFSVTASVLRFFGGWFKESVILRWLFNAFLAPKVANNSAILNGVFKLAAWKLRLWKKFYKWISKLNQSSFNRKVFKIIIEPVRNPINAVAAAGFTALGFFVLAAIFNITNGVQLAVYVALAAVSLLVSIFSKKLVIWVDNSLVKASISGLFVERGRKND